MMMSWGVFLDGMTVLSCNSSQTSSVWIICTFYFTKLFPGTSVCKVSSESLDLQSSFVQKIVLEIIHVQVYNRSLDSWSYAKFESCIFSMTCLELASGANNSIVMITYNDFLLFA
jgi:hypothetical protein